MKTWSCRTDSTTESFPIGDGDVRFVEPDYFADFCLCTYLENGPQPLYAYCTRYSSLLVYSNTVSELRYLHISLNRLWRGVVFVVVDSHIQRIVLATEETTVTQQVNHESYQMPIPLVVSKMYEGQRVTSW